ncbi:MAG: hypothetical protein Q8N58_02105 [bacterium]|nr:hypothetical protein [bacterium]
MLSKISIIIIIGIIIIILIFIYLFIYYFSIRTGDLASKKFEEWQKIYGRVKARQMTIDWLKKQIIVKKAGVSNDETIWIEFITGMEIDIPIYPFGTL